MDTDDGLKKTLHSLALAFDGIPASTGRVKQWRQFNEFIASLVARGWDRAKIYSLVFDELSKPEADLPEDSYDALGDYCDGLLGRCHPDCFVRLPGEPEDEKEFIEYVRNNYWLKRQ